MGIHYKFVFITLYTHLATNKIIIVLRDLNNISFLLLKTKARKLKFVRYFREKFKLQVNL